jgi:hypothetical protein
MFCPRANVQAEKRRVINPAAVPVRRSDSNTRIQLLGQELGQTTLRQINTQIIQVLSFRAGGEEVRRSDGCHRPQESTNV